MYESKQEKRILNITNGDYFNNYFLSKFGGEALPFREAMMDGDTVLDIYSQDFIYQRAKSLCVSPEEYTQKACVFDTLQKNTYDELNLWFGEDTFCQVNLLTLLAYLEQISFSGKVTLHHIDDETFAILKRNVDVTLGSYQKIYADILIQRWRPNEIGVLNQKAMDLYFDYLSPTGALSMLVKENADMNKPALLRLLIENSKDYGLSSMQAERLIQRNAK